MNSQFKQHHKTKKSAILNIITAILNIITNNMETNKIEIINPKMDKKQTNTTRPSRQKRIDQIAALKARREQIVQNNTLN
jgi:hypothetical protein